VHTPTLVVSILVIMSLVTLSVVASYLLNRRFTYLRDWSFALLASFLIVLVYSFETTHNSKTWVFLTQGLLLGGSVMTLVGTCRYLRFERIPYLPIVLSLIAILAFNASLIMLSEDFLTSFRTSSVVAGLVFVVSGLAISTRDMRANLERNFAALIATVHGLYLGGRTLFLNDSASSLMFGLGKLRGVQFMLFEQMIMVPLFGLVLLLLLSDEKSKELRILAETDSLTSLFNRRTFLSLADKACSLARRNGYPVCVLVIDVDHFKLINDSYGHDVGDEVLRSVANLIFGCLRTEDVIGRLGGEEFAVLLPNTPIANAAPVAERIRAKVHETPTAKGRDIACSVSIGVAQFETDETPQIVMRRADMAMYFAKANGRNRVEYALSSEDPQVLDESDQTTAHSAPALA